MFSNVQFIEWLAMILGFISILVAFVSICITVKDKNIRNSATYIRVHKALNKLRQEIKDINSFILKPSIDGDTYNRKFNQFIFNSLSLESKLKDEILQINGTIINIPFTIMSLDIYKIKTDAKKYLGYLEESIIEFLDYNNIINSSSLMKYGFEKQYKLVYIKENSVIIGYKYVEVEKMTTPDDSFENYSQITELNHKISKLGEIKWYNFSKKYKQIKFLKKISKLKKIIRKQNKLELSKK